MTFQDDFRKAWFKSKTMIFNLLMMLAGASAFFTPVIDELENTGLEPQTISWLRVGMLIVGAVGSSLRMATAGGVTLK